LIAGKTRERRARARDGSGQYPRQTSAKWASSAAFPRANGGVWAVRGDVVKRVAQRARAEVTRASEATGALDVPVVLAVHALARACARLGASGRVAFCTLRWDSSSRLGLGVIRRVRGACKTRWCRVEVKGEGDGTGWPCHATAWSCPCHCEQVEVLARRGTGAER
jgi:hypothetical protein